MDETPESKLYRLGEQTPIDRGTWRVAWKNVGTGEQISRRLSQAEYEALKWPDEKPLWTLEEIEATGEPDAMRQLGL